MSADLARTQLLALADALPPGASVSLDADALRRLAGVELATDEASPARSIADLTAEAAGAELGRSSSTVRSWCASGRISGAYRLNGREWRIPVASLRRYLDAQADGATRPADTEPASGGSVDLGRWRKVYRRGSR